MAKLFKVTLTFDRPKQDVVALVIANNPHQAFDILSAERPEITKDCSVTVDVIGSASYVLQSQ